MPEHFTKSVVVASFWCARCRKPTMHNVNGGRRGSCHECIKRLEAIKPKPKNSIPIPEQPNLF